MTLTQPGPTVQQISSPGFDGRPMLTVLAKRSYRLLPDGRCTVADEQIPLYVDGVFDEAKPSRIVHDTDLFPYKPLTDVVVKGHATSFPARSRFDAAVEVAGMKKVVAVLGERMAALAGSEILFSPPSPIERVPLQYDFAYGGCDRAALEKYGDPIAELREAMTPDTPGPEIFYEYPRNPSGVGYLLEPTVDAVNRLVLPNLEDPLDLLTPERIVAKQPGFWLRQPIPHSFDWMAPGNFPRLAYIAIPAPHDPYEGLFPEAKRGWAEPNLLEERSMRERSNHRLANGASLGLQLPYLKGDESIRLTHIHPKSSQFVVKLPGQRPRIWIDGRKAGLKETQPVLHTVVVDTDGGTVTLVWRGSEYALRPYMAQELETMPLKVEW